MNRIVWMVVLTALNWTTFTQGAPINWGRVKDVSSSAEVINRGTLIEAFFLVHRRLPGQAQLDEGYSVWQTFDIKSI